MAEQYKNGDRSIGWFKLALLVSRKEKEKALSLYRLLSYSFEDKAYVLQVEGDILWAFKDQEALTKYQQAAFLYSQEQKVTHAISLYEYLRSLDETNFAFFLKLFELYIKVQWKEKLKELMSLLMDLHAQKKIEEKELSLIFKGIKENITFFAEPSIKSYMQELAEFYNLQNTIV